MGSEAQVQQIITELKNIKKEITALKLLILKQNKPAPKKGSLKGLLKGTKIEEADIEHIKKELFRLSA